ncbi:MAG: OmpA family protein, partial [Dokdonella sp.]
SAHELDYRARSARYIAERSITTSRAGTRTLHPASRISMKISIRPSTILPFFCLLALIFSDQPEARANEPPLVDPPLFELGRVFFDEGHPSSGESLCRAISKSTQRSSSPSEIAEFLIQHPNLRVEIFGHADSKECERVNCSDLSERRASLVYRWLLDHGVPKNQIISYHGRGTTHPMDRSDNEHERQNNRRVDFEVTDVQQDVPQHEL